MTNMLTATELRDLLGLVPLPGEGGFYVETYRATNSIPSADLPSVYGEQRSYCTAIYYLLTPETVSAMHRLPGDEIYHFYLGDPVEMLQLSSAGTGKVVILGSDVRSGMRLQHVVPGGAWQGSKLKNGGKFALMGTTMAPGFEFADYAPGNRADLTRQFPAFAEMIRHLTHS